MNILKSFILAIIVASVGFSSWHLIKCPSREKDTVRIHDTIEIYKDTLNIDTL